jgi:tRNA(fMet)-specific endonuclease VapC
MKYMLDTNMCIYLIKKQPKNIFEKFRTLDLGDVCISSITLSELMYGVQKSQHQEKNKAALEEFLSPIDILSFDQDAAFCYGEIRALLEKSGMIIGPLDMMIAAHAKSVNAVIVTNNTKEFSRVVHLKIENWISSI